jgi:hypothetical protein
MAEEPSIVAPAAVGFGIAGAMAFGFGAGYGTRSFSASTAYKELLEKFPEPPTAEAEALARSGATRALFAGTALAGLMGVGAVALARSYGVNSAADFADEVKKWLPTRDGLEVCVCRIAYFWPSSVRPMEVCAALRTVRRLCVGPSGDAHIPPPPDQTHTKPLPHCISDPMA